MNKPKARQAQHRPGYDYQGGTTTVGCCALKAGLSFSRRATTKAKRFVDAPRRPFTKLLNPTDVVTPGHGGVTCKSQVICRAALKIAGFRGYQKKHKEFVN